MIKRILVCFIIATIFFVFGFFVSAYKYKNIKNSHDYFQEGWNAAMKRVKKFGVCEVIDENLPITSVTGTIKTINNNEIELNIFPYSPFESPDLDKRVVIVDKNTELFQSVKIDPEKYKKILDDFYKTKDDYPNEDEFLSHMPPDKTEKKISLTDLKVGQTITVVAYKNIRKEKKFLAKRIKVVQLDK